MLHLQMIYFFRILDLIRGLCTSLNTEVSFIDIFALYAQKALLDTAVLALPRLRSSRMHPRRKLDPRFDKLQANVQLLLDRFVEDRLIVGCQVVCYVKGRATTSCVAGTQGWNNPTPVSHETLFPTLELTSSMMACIAHYYAKEGTLNLDHSLQHYVDAAPANITVREVLEQRAGLHTTLTASDIRNIHALKNYNQMLDKIWKSIPIPAIGAQPSCVADGGVAEGYVLAAVLEGAINLPFDAILQNVKSALDIPKADLAIGGPCLQAGGEDERAGRLARLSNGFIVDMKQLGKMQGTIEVDQSKMHEFLENPEMTRLLSQTNANNVNVREALIPSLTGFATADACCKLFTATSERVPEIVHATGYEKHPFFGDRSWSTGFHCYEPGSTPGKKWLGRQVFGGSLCLVCPEESVSVAILINDLRLDPTPIQQLLDVFSDHLKLEFPSVPHVDMVGFSK